MRHVRILTLSFAAVFVAGVAGAQFELPFGHVRSWSGTVSIEATSSKSGGGQTKTVEYRAAGPLTIADEVMPDGAHQQWPQPPVTEQAAYPGDAFKKWNAHVTFKHTLSGVGELGNRIGITCSADENKTTRVQLVTPFMAPTYELTIDVPEVAERGCTGDQAYRAGFALKPIIVQVAKRGAPLAGTDTRTIGDFTVKVTYSLAPK